MTPLNEFEQEPPTPVTDPGADGDRDAEDALSVPSFTGAITQRVGAAHAGQEWDETRQCWCFNWYFTARIVGCDITPELLFDLSDQGALVQAAVEHVKRELARPAGEPTKRTFAIVNGVYHEIPDE